MRSRLEAISGIDLSDVRVHANSAEPAQFNALAYAKGNDVHLGPGQGRYLPHEAWHVVQQKSGRVRPTGMCQGRALNDDGALESEADRIGSLAGSTRALSIRHPHHVPVRFSNSPIQRKVTTFQTTPDKEKTILGVLADANLSAVYELPEEFDKHPRKGSKTLDRAKEARADITKKGSTERGKPTGDYNDISALGRWERLALSHDKTVKTIDTGHLIADEFFDDNQKKDAYVAANLAPQIAEFNEKAYRDLVEKPVGRDLDEDREVHLEVKLYYGNAPLKLPVNVLVERGALEVIDQQKHDQLIQSGKELSVPRRMAMDWQAKRSIDLTKSKGKKKSKGSTTLSPSPLLAHTSYAKADPTRKTFTPAVTFTVDVKPPTATSITHIFQQGHTFEDPRGIMNPAKIGANPETGRFNKSQVKRGRKTVADAFRWKLLNQARSRIHKKPPKGHATRPRAEVLEDVLTHIISAPQGTTAGDVFKEVRIDIQSYGYDNVEMQDVDKDLEGALSEGEDEDFKL